MAARTPEEIDRLFAEALNAGSLDALTALYEPQATPMLSPGKLVEVLRRQSDGRWLFAVDLSFGTGA